LPKESLRIRLKRLTLPGKPLSYVLNRVKAVVDLLPILLSMKKPKMRRLAAQILRLKGPYTMVSVARLLNLAELISRVDEAGTEGDIVECGVWRGGSAALMARTHTDNCAARRDFWLFDSFEGLPPPDEYATKLTREIYVEGWCEASIAAVEEAFTVVGLTMEQVHVVPGWFDETLPNHQITKIALLHIDADFHDSVHCALTYLYPQVVPGGYVVFDDFGSFRGCKIAVLDFIEKQGLGSMKLHIVDEAGAYFRKPEQDHIAGIGKSAESIG